MHALPRPALLAALLATVPVAVWANMAEPPEPAPVRAGDVLGEPAGGLRDVFVEHERLNVDLRPLAKAKPAVVEATYRTRNDGAPRTLDLLFVADGLRGAGEVWLDGRPVASRRVTPGPLPASWRAPATTPAPGRGEALEYQAKHAGALAFQLPLPAGRHEIRVRYPAQASVFQTSGLMPVWQLGYVLAPAREWGGFGRLDVRVEVPKGWGAAATPALRHEGGALVGSWRGIPADALALSVQEPEPRSGWRYGVWLAFCAVGLWLCVRGGRLAGEALGRRGRGAAWALPVTMALATAWTIAAIITLLLIPEWIAAAAGPFANPYVLSRMSYSSGMGLILAAPLFPLIGTIAGQIGAVRGRRAALAK
ncbi:MAG TPA: hypothetical protein VF613_14020 [Longimicrobium sp.]|jgi:hypothetical protein